MSILLLMTVALFAADNIPASKDLFTLLEQAKSNINWHDYDANAHKEERRMNDQYNLSFYTPKEPLEQYKRFTDAFMEHGLTYDLKSDTLLLLFSIPRERRFGSGDPDYAYVKTKKVEMVAVEKFDVRDHLIINTRVEARTEAKVGNNPEIQLLYEGDEEGFRKLFEMHGHPYFDGSYSTAYRIVLRDGHIISPSICWDYSDIMIMD